jgi:hypothetical protein
MDKRIRLVATARLVDADAQASTQNVLIVASIALGIVGSLLAAMVWEFLQGWPTASEAGTRASTQVVGDGRGFLLLLGALLLEALSRWARRRRS